MGTCYTLHEQGIKDLTKYASNKLKETGKPIIIEIKYRSRTNDQNALINALYRDIANIAKEQGYTFDQVRAMSKLHVGIPLMREESEKFRLQYDTIVKPAPYEMKLELMLDPIDFPVTRIMTTSQLSEYSKRLCDYWSQQGYPIMLPNEPPMQGAL